MVRDYSAFFQDGISACRAGRMVTTLEALGWGPFFSQQTDVDELAGTLPTRVVAVHRSGLRIMGEGLDETIPPIVNVAVGDWLMLDRAEPTSSRLLERKSLIKRRAPGTDRQVQLIAANIDTAFVVTSCNQDFNLARLERYLALAFDAEIEPVIILTKTDLVEDPQTWIDAARSISERVSIVALDARADDPGTLLAEWCRPGRTVAFLGSSGVGKSTLANALLGTSTIATQPVREDDAKGRHTTTRRELHVIPGRCIVLDTPGMRELQLADAAAGIADVFDDIVAFATHCRFRDCHHETEPDCAVQAAVAAGRLDPSRLARWRKLRAEDAFNSASLSERRSRDREFGKMVRHAMNAKQSQKTRPT